MSVSADGERALIGSYAERALVFRRDGSVWTAEARLEAENQGWRDFGVDVSLSGNTAVVGAPEDSDAGYHAGAAYLFRQDETGWDLRAKLVASDAEANDRLGSGVAAEADFAVVAQDTNRQNAHVFGIGTTDTDNDGVVDVCDQCPGFDDRLDADADGVPDDCDACPGYDDDLDSDYDDIPDDCDACPGFDDRSDRDGDGIPDGCDIPGHCTMTKLTVDDADHYTRFGDAVALQGGRLVVGATFADGNDIYTGAAYVFRREGTAWLPEAKLAASDGQWFTSFGFSVAVNADVIVIGAPDDDFSSRTGAVYVYRWDGAAWIEEAKLTAADGHYGDSFGYSVGVDGDCIVVGAPEHWIGEYGGTVYVFQHDSEGWAEAARLEAFPPLRSGTPDYFGRSVSIDGDYILSGAPGIDISEYETDEYGFAFVFRREGREWVPDTWLGPADPHAWQLFGWTVSLDAPYAAVAGAYDEVYIFQREGSQWVERAKLVPTGDDTLGITAIELGEDLLIVPARVGYRDAAYVYRYDDGGTPDDPGDDIWAKEALLTQFDTYPDKGYGRSIAVDGGVAAIGAVDPYGHNAGDSAVYVYDLASPDCNENGLCDWRDIEDGTSQDNNANGIPDECECVGDLDGDADTDQSDLGILLADWGCQSDCAGDLDGDGDTDQGDLGILVADWGCGT